MKQSSIYRSAEGRTLIREQYRSILDRWPVPWLKHDIETGCGNTFVLECGNPLNPPLILLHGSCSNALSWMGDVAEYARRFRVFIPDLPGEPGLSSENRPSWNTDAFSVWLGEVADSLGLEKFNLCGLSQGGWVALKLATQNPNRVEKLVLLTSGGIVNPRFVFLLRVILYSLLGGWGRRKINDMVIGSTELPKEAWDFMNLIMTHFRPRIGAQPVFADKQLKNLTMPVLYLAGGRDAIVNVSWAEERLRKNLPRLSTVIRPKAGHVLQGTSPEVIRFFSS